MRTLVGFVAFNGLALAFGLAALAAAGLVARRLRAAVAAAGAALMVGLAALGLGAMISVIAGIGLDLKVFTACAVLATAALAVVAWRPAPAPEPDLEPAGTRWWAGPWLPVAVVVGFTAIQMLASRDVPVAWDAAHNWTLKAVALTTMDHLDGDIFTGGAFSAAHEDYPLLHPVLGA